MLEVYFSVNLGFISLTVIRMQNFSDGPQQLLSVSVFKDSPDLTSEKAHKAVGKKKKKRCHLAFSALRIMTRGNKCSVNEGRLNWPKSKFTLRRRVTLKALE